MYLVHYVFVVWLQYAALVAIAKASIVFGVTLLLSGAATAIMCRDRLGARLVGTERRVLAKAL